MYIWIDGSMDGWMDGCMDGCMKVDIWIVSVWMGECMWIRAYEWVCG